MESPKKTEETLKDPVSSEEISWPFWPVVPLYPYGRRRTLRTEVLKDTIWTFEQLQGILYVVVPIRMTVVKLEAGGLLVYAPVAPTGECIRLVQELVARHGEVKYIILPTVSGLEHKVFVGPFARRFPHAQVWVLSDQWSYPLNLPLSWLGFPQKRTYILTADNSQIPFLNEFDAAILGPVNLGLGKFGEVALFHRRSQTLLLTDTIISIPENPPKILQLDPYPLLFHAKDDAFDAVIDSEAVRRMGWQRICLFALYFRPSALETVKLLQAVREAFKAPDRSKKAYFGLFPFKWKPDWKQSFEAVHRNGQLLVAPVLQTLVLSRGSKETLKWADQIASWDFQCIIPCHFDSPLAATADSFRQAFTFLEKQSNPQLLPKEDFELLRQLNQVLNQSGIVPPED